MDTIPGTKKARVPFFLAAGAILAGVLVAGLVASRLHHEPDYSPSEPVSAEVPLPANVVLSTSHAEILPHEHRNFSDRVVAAHDLSRSLPAGLVVVTDPPDDFNALAETYRDALAQAQGKEMLVQAGCGLTILAVGPLLSSKQTAQVVHLDCQNHHVALDIGYGVPRGGLIPVPQSKGWRPLAVVPLLLNEGHYTITVNWSEIGEPADPTTPPPEPTISTCAFTVPAGVIRSETIRVHGADFQTLTDGRCALPCRGASRYLHCGLAVFNRGGQDLYLNPKGIHLAPWSVQTARGRSLLWWGGSDREWPAEPICVRPGWGYVFVIRGHLHWPDNGQGLRLSGELGPYRQVFWQYDGLENGEYRLSFEYSCFPAAGAGSPLWSGCLRTNNIRFELVAD